MPLTAEEWAVRLRQKALGDEERAAFDAWVADPDHRADLEKCLGMSVMVSALRANPQIAPDLIARARRLRGKGGSLRHRVLWPAAALAAGAAIVVIGTLRLAPPAEPVPQREVVTVRGEQRSLALEDGSVMQVNTDSAVSYAFSATERRVELQRGEAFFDVKRDPSRPFIVKAGASEVQVVGTQFSVRRAADRTDVVVTEGRVNVVPNAGFLASLMPKVELTPGHRLRLARDNQLKVSAVDAAQATAWRTGSIAFDNTSLEEVVAEVNRYASTQVVVEDPRLKARVLSGRVRIGDLETFLSLLKVQFGIEAVERNGTIALTAS
jgi:transmembrane sensor